MPVHPVSPTTAITNACSVAALFKAARCGSENMYESGKGMNELS